MRFKRYAVTVMDNWTAMRTFWTWAGACKFAYDTAGARMWEWRDGQWQQPRF